MYRKLSALALIIVSAIIIITGCAAPATTRPQPAQQSDAVTVSGDLSCVIEDGKAKLTLTTDIMDGAIIRMSLESRLGGQLAYADVVKNGDSVYTELDVAGIEEETVYAFATCGPSQYGSQPREVIDKYGRSFENVYCEDENAILWTGGQVYIVFTTGEVKL